MSKHLRTWIGSTRFDIDRGVNLKEYEYSDGSIHYTFYGQTGCPSNPTKEEAEQIIKNWKLELTEDFREFWKD